MIINTGQRTDIPAYYSKWFYNRIKEGFVYVRNPYNPESVTKYELNPDVVDLICFCSKNPEPILGRLNELNSFRQLWHITITPYSKDIEENVPDWQNVADSLKRLSGILGPKAVYWRYDPIFISEKYSISFHINIFEEMCAYMSGYTQNCIFSFIDLYEKTKRNFPGIQGVPKDIRFDMARQFKSIADRYKINLISCCEDSEFSEFGIDVTGCLTKDKIQNVLGESFDIPLSEGKARKECNCLLSHDIGAYNTCGHLCKYCYANYDSDIVAQNMKRHDPDSPILIGNISKNDVIHIARQKKYSYGQLRLF